MLGLDRVHGRKDRRLRTLRDRALRVSAILVTLSLLLVEASDGGGVPVTSTWPLPHFGGGGGHHRVGAMPAQRWGSAAGQQHLVGSSGNHTQPSTLRSTYPLHDAAPPPKPKPNTASVVAPPPSTVRGYDPKTSMPESGHRGAYDTTYANTDGTETTEFSSTPVNYRSTDGSWAPIDPRLVPAGGGWRNAADSVGVRLAGRADAADLASVSFDAGHAMAFALQGAAGVAGAASGSAVTYPGARPGVDVELQSVDGGVKETLVLHSAQAPTSFVFPLHLTGLSARLSGGDVVLSDASGAPRAVIPAGSMSDAAGARDGGAGVTYQLTGAGANLALTVTLDAGWLADPARAFPVRVDPSVASSAADSSLVVSGGHGGSGNNELQVGDVGGSNASSYIKFGGLPSQLQYHTIYGAQLQVVNYDAESCKARPVSVYPVTSSWSSNDSSAPSVGSALTSKSFAYGHIGLGQSQSSCPTSAVLFDLGNAGRKLVQGWVNGQPNYGLAFKAPSGESDTWKAFAGTSTANAPKLYVTHSPYNATYSIPSPVPNPPVLQNQNGTVKVTVTNLSAAAWTPGNYYLAYRAYNEDTGKAVTQQRAANLTSTVARNAKVTLDATIKALPPGKYFLDFTMVRTGGPVFTDEQVPPGRIVIQVFDIPPVFQALFPPNGYQAQTLTPQLWANALDIDAPPGSSLQYRFEVCEQDASGNPVNCTTTAYQKTPEWTVPAGQLKWSKTYLWRSFVKDASNEVASDRSALLTSVPQPEITSHVANAPYGTQDKEYDPQVGNYSTAAVDASEATVGPALTVVRTYNSLDPRRTSLFGAGWTTQYDMKLVPDNDGTGNVVVSYPDGEEVRFGKNPDGSYAPPAGRDAQLTPDGTGGWKLLDKTGSSYQFAAGGRLAKITDVALRSVVLTYDNTGKLTKAQVSNSQTNTAGRSLTFTWSGAHVATVSTDPVDGARLTWNYTYTGDLLTKVCAPGSVCTGYDYETGSHYRSSVLDDRPESYYRLGESGGTAAGSQIAVNLGKDAGTYHNVTLGTTGSPLAGSADTAGTFNGTSSYLDLPEGLLKKSRDAAVELWFKSPVTSSGGPLVGYQDKAVGQASTLGVPVLYQGMDGKLHGQFWTGTAAPISSTKLVNDGKWHHAVLSEMGNTQTLYLDGAVMGTLTGSPGDTSTLTYNQVGAGYASSPTSWPGWGSTAQRYYNGVVDEVATYTHPLGPTAVAAHYQYGTTAADQLTTVTLPSGKVATQVGYDTDTDRVTTYTDDNGGTWTIGAPVVYGGDTDLRRAVEVLDPSGRPYLYEYDALAGRMVRSGSPLGLTIKDEDKAGYTPPTTAPTPTPSQVCTSPDPGDPQFCTTIPGDADGPVFVGHDLDGMAIRTFGYDANGFQNQVTNENGDTVTMTYDARGNVTSTTTCRTRTTPSQCQTSYNTYPTVTSPFDPRNDVPIQTRDARSASATDNTYRTSYTYSSTGEVATQTNPDNGTTFNTFTTGAEAAYGGGAMPPGLLLKSTDPRNAITKYSYYANGDLAQSVDPSGLTTTFTYDALGRKVSETEVSSATPSGVTTTYTYDALSRLVSTTEPPTTDVVTNVQHQGRTTNTYDADGNLTRTDVADLLGGDPTRTTTYDYDDHDRLVRVTDALGNETSYGYDDFGNRTSMVDANGNEYEYGYTARNMIAEIRLRDWHDDPDGAGDAGPGDELVLHSYAYDFAGRMVSDTDAMGHHLEYAYYDDDLLKSITLKGMHNPDGSTRDYVVESDSYDAAGNPTQQVTGNGSVTTASTYGANGQVASTVVDPGGLSRATAFTYDQDGNVTEVRTSGNPSNVPWAVSATPEVVDYNYDLSGNQTRQTQTAGGATRVTTYNYDPRGLLTSTVDPRGNVSGADPTQYTTTYQYDALNRPTTVTMPAVATEHDGQAPVTTNPTQLTGYDTFDEPVETQDELGNVTRVGYDALGRQTSVTEPPYKLPAGSTITPVSSSQYDALGNVTESKDPRGNVTKYTYDRLNRMVTQDEPSATNDDRAVWHYTYTRTGDVLSVTDPTGARVETTYDDLDRPVTLTEVERKPTAVNLTTRYTYDDAGDATSVVSPTGATTTSEYDKAGELTRSTDPSHVVTQYGYDFDGRQVRQTDGMGRTSQSVYDGFGLLSSDSDLDAQGNVLRTEHYGYDQAGNLTTATDPQKHDTTYTYDALDQLTSQTEPVTDSSSITTSFGYDAAGERTRYTDGRQNSTIYTFNSLGLPQAVIEPATDTQPALADRTWTATYDANGNPVAMTAPGGVTDQRTFDAADRLTAETGTGAEAQTTDRALDYDLAGRLTKASAPGGTDTYTYDDRGLMLSAAGPSGTASFGYDGDGQVTSRTDAAGTATFGYLNGRLNTETDGLTGVTQTLGYDASGQLSTVDYGAGRVRTYGYDDFGRTDSDTLRNGADQTVSSIGYGYDSNDDLTSKTTAGTAGAAQNTYGYDYAGRLTSWTNGSAGTTQYDWDASGNRTRAGDKTATYDQRDRVLSDGEYSYDYDARGDLTSRTSSGYTEDFSFDAFDRLISDDGNGYSYDGLDRLATRNDTTFDYAGQDDQPVSDGTTDYAYGALDELLAIGQGQQDQQDQLAVTDQHGDVVGGFDPDDTTLSGLSSSTAYDPYGNVIATDGSDGNLGYQGEWTDPDTDQVNMGARWYDPSSGTFDSRDDVDYTSGDSILANRYTYAAGDPMDETDPDGHWPSCGWCHKAAHAVTSTVKKAASTVYHAAVTVANYAWSAVKTVAHAISSAAKWVYDKAKAAVKYVASKVVSAAKWVYNKAAAAAQWAAQKAAQAKAAALAAAKHVTAVAKSAAKWAADHNPLPALAAAVKPIYSGLKKVVSASAHVAASVVSTVRDVVQDVAKSVKVIYQQAVQAAGVVVQAVDTAAQAVSEFAQEHAGEIAGIAAGALVGIGCGVAIGWTGVGAVGCAALAGAVGGAVANAMNCPPGHSIAGCAAIGAVAGGVGGAIAAATGGLGGGFAVAMLGGGLAAAGSDATTQLLTTGHINAGEVLEQGVVGAATGGLLHGAGKLASGVCGGNSFAAGTEVLMADGSHRRIEDVRIGDKVIATDPTTGKTSVQPVTDVITGTGKKSLVSIAVAAVSGVGAGGSAGTVAASAAATGAGGQHANGFVIATANHPFWVDDRGQPISHDPTAGGHWEDAYSLTPGQRLEGQNDTDASVVSTDAYTLTTTVYNLTIDGVHTYYVLAGDTPVLVHNCATFVPKDAGHRLTYDLRDAEGNSKVSGSLWSGNTTPEESQVPGGWNRQAVTNTENRLMRMFGLPAKQNIPNDPYFGLHADVPVEEGDTLHLWGELDPCGRCKNLMSEFIEGMGADIQYHGPSGTWPK
ncbi:polymorphic toxin-type HINT domain-containing protein [Rugosimonospora acidiphila]|uniref:Polymorphic toxin-type HINT domain-containing protein n=2 Tax=Rugosimonospora acidiphila TaxID=556531 RepID=A0ABP9RJ49_9ACTN